MSAPSSVLPLDVRPGRPAIAMAGGRPPTDWMSANRESLRAAVLEHGAVLVRGLGLRDVPGAGATFARLGNQPFVEREAFAARTQFGPGLYSSTTWPAQQQMCMHHELSYRTEVPGLMMFGCLRAPESGGITATADAAAVLKALPPDLVDRFNKQGWQLVRTYTEEIGASWAEAFGTGDRGAVEHYCGANGIRFEWLPGDGLRTWQRRPALLKHPVTGRWGWFNQIAFLSEFTMDPDVRDFLVEEYGPDGLPFTTRFGDGAPVGPDIVALINDVYERHTKREPWQPGDVLVVDNLASAHSREAYTGEREIVVGIADPVVLR